MLSTFYKAKMTLTSSVYVESSSACFFFRAGDEKGGGRVGRGFVFQIVSCIFVYFFVLRSDFWFLGSFFSSLILISKDILSSKDKFERILESYPNTCITYNSSIRLLSDVSVHEAFKEAAEDPDRARLCKIFFS